MMGKSKTKIGVYILGGLLIAGIIFILGARIYVSTFCPPAGITTTMTVQPKGYGTLQNDTIHQNLTVFVETISYPNLTIKNLELNIITTSGVTKSIPLGTINGTSDYNVIELNGEQVELRHSDYWQDVTVQTQDPIEKAILTTDKINSPSPQGYTVTGLRLNGKVSSAEDNNSLFYVKYGENVYEYELFTLNNTSPPPGPPFCPSTGVHL